ncbi:hypothetical protein GGR57DRAFT_473504 [Xylariaceae sp. FL1272]|nr:hypothetical protein GGR57DRAFT_473504 [Xylariaceae sp. FL1272]
MVEASLPTFDTFCEHHDASSLFADQAYLRQYEEIVRAYAAFASTGKTPGKGTPSKPVALRWRNAGLEAIKSITTSDALSTVSGRQLNVVVPMILENLWTDDDEYLGVLVQHIQIEEKVDSNALLRRRTSVSTVRTAETGGDTNPIAITGTSGDIDKLAEEETGVEAMQCLKQIFAISNRAQLYGATTALIHFTQEKMKQKEAVVKFSADGHHDSGWAIKIFELVTRWAPVQDRYAIMITLTDTLFRSPPTQENISEQVVLAAVIGSLLRSDINLIGLSVIDVLLGFIQHMKRTLRYFSTAPNGEPSSSAHEVQDQISPQQAELLDRLQQCMGYLATHVYYADQISDMISSVLLRLKPRESAMEPVTQPERHDASPAPGASTGNVSEDQHHLDSFFSMTLAEITALKAIKSILLIANPKTKLSGNISLRRNKVPIQVWEGTHWLLRDSDGQVRQAYADALITWLDRETTRADLKARDETSQNPSRVKDREVLPAASSRRAVSNATAKEKPAKVPRSYFLQMLHLAIYENANQYVEYDADIALLHALLTKLVMKLGVNAARYGLPMVFRLQEDIQETDAPLSKVRLGCLCHGYFWALSEHFDFESSAVGRLVHNEIVRRRSKHFWVEGVQVPPPSPEHLAIPGSPNMQRKMSIHEIESEALLPFDDRATMVECICTNYQEGAKSPPSSPSASPGRAFSQPILSSTLSTIPPAGEEELPNRFREEMLVEWTRAAALMAIQEGSKSASLNGSKTGTTATRKNRLAANGHSPSRPGSAYAAQTNLHPTMNGGIHGTYRKSRSVQSRGSGKSSSARGFVASVDQLKSALSGDAVRPSTFHTVREDDSSSDSMVSYDVTASELSFNPQTAEGGETNEPSTSRSRQRTGSNESGGPLTSHPMSSEEDEDAVPPVPPLPASFASQSPDFGMGVDRADHAAMPKKAGKTSRRSVKSRGGESFMTNSFAEADDAGVMDLQSLLKGIDTKSTHNTLGNLSRPPY